MSASKDPNQSEDSDAVQAKVRKIKEETSKQKKEEKCSICLEPWTIGGNHRIVSIKCGHFFGRKCIEKWLTTEVINSKCPLCKTEVNKDDIRNHFITSVRNEKTDELKWMEYEKELHKSSIQLKKYETDLSELRLNNLMLGIKDDQLRRKHNPERTESISNSSSNKYLQFEIIGKYDISEVGESGVMSYSNGLSSVIVSCSTRNPLGYGFKVLHVADQIMDMEKQIHDQIIRDLKCSPDISSTLLSGSQDKTVKLTSLTTRSNVCSWKCEYPVWSVCWSNNPNLFYAGLENGSVCELDSRKPNYPCSLIWEQTGGPIHSLNYSFDRAYTSDPGLIVSNADGTIFVPNKNGMHDISGIYNTYIPAIISLETPRTYRTKISRSIYNNSTGHLLSTMCIYDVNQTYVVSKVGKNEDIGTNIFSTYVKSIHGGKSTKNMSRSCFLNQDDGDLLALCPNEEKASANIYNLNSGMLVYSFPQEDNNKPFLDVCQIHYSDEALMFGMLNSSNLYVLREKADTQ